MDKTLFVPQQYPLPVTTTQASITVPANFFKPNRMQNLSQMIELKE